MKPICATLVSCLGLTACSLASAQPLPPGALTPRHVDYYLSHAVQELAGKLGSPSYSAREKARRDLEALGPRLALAPLRRLGKSADPEIDSRVAELIRLFEHQLVTEQILAPKVVTLNLKDAEVRQAIQELAKESGYPIQYFGDATTFTEKKITLSGKLPFWEALDRLCEQAGLMERVDSADRIDLQGPDMLPRQPQPSAGPIVLVNRGKEKSLVSHAGAVRTELRICRDAKSRELKLQFVVSAEPRLLNHGVIGDPQLEKANDERGQRLSRPFVRPLAPEPVKEDPYPEFVPRMPPLLLNPRVTDVRLKDEHDSRLIKELSGSLTLQTNLPNDVLARLDNFTEAAGRSAFGAGGGSMKVNSIKKLVNGDFEVQLSLHNLGKNPFGDNIFFNGGGGVVIQGNIQIQGGGGIVIGPGGVQLSRKGGSLKDLPDLLDAKGNKFKLSSSSGDIFHMNNGSTTRSATVTYQPVAGQAEPSSLVLYGTRTYVIAVPFRFTNVPLP